MKRATIGILAVAIIAAVAYTIFKSRPEKTAPVATAPSHADSVAADSIKKLEAHYGIQLAGLQMHQDVIRRDQRFADLLSNVFLSPLVWQQLNLLSPRVFDFRTIAHGRKYALFSKPDSLHSAVALVYESSPVDYTIFHFGDSLRVESRTRPVITVEKSITGTILSSLYETIDAQNISPELTNKFVDIFGWQVDFQQLQRGDRFKLMYEEQTVEGETVGIGQILGIYFEHFGHPYYAFPFDQGEGIDYFDERGNSLRKALLKYPIEFTRISSRYSLNRFHPVAKEFRPHLGTDFAAPTGMPIRSVGDGIVLEAQYAQNNGNYVKIRHNGTYTTGYLHMSRIAVTAGTHVRQGQVIGYVGSTGLATGPHLCYRFWRNGVQVDALRVELPPSQPVAAAQWGRYDDVMAETLLKLNSISFPPETTLASLP